MANIYTRDSVESLVNDLTENSGYSTAALSATKIGLGSFVLIAPDEYHYNFLVEEIALGYDRTGYRVTKRRKISHEMRKRMDAAQHRIDGFCDYLPYELLQ